MKGKYLLFIILYMSIGLVPYFESADKVTPQMFCLNIINISALIYIGFVLKKNIFKELAGSLKNMPLILYFLFFIWSAITVTNAVNTAESLATLGEIFTLLVSFVFLIYFISKINNIKKIFFYIIMGLLILEVGSVIFPYLYEIYTTGSPTQRGMIYRGYTGNINILAYILLIKFPFLVYFQITKQGNYRLNFLLISTIVFIISAIFATRSAILSLFIISILMILFVTYLGYKNNLKGTRSLLFKTLILPVFLGLVMNNLESRTFETTSFQSRLATLNDIGADNSLSQRLRYYQAALESFTEAPIMGKGIGTWEYESIKYERAIMPNYVVPYHAHNDYLETLAETGLIGFLLYFGIIGFVCYNLLRKILDQESSYETKLFSTFLIVSFTVYLIDSMFNFPFDRTLQQMHLFFLIAISINFLNLKKLNTSLIRIIIPLILVLTPISIYSSSRLVVSSNYQKIFLIAFNRSDYSTPSLEVIDEFDINYKSLGPTALPMATIKGLYYINNNREREAVELFKKGIKDNPYLSISESFLGYTYNVLGMPDSALYYAKQGFEKMPKNTVHYANYVNALVQFGDSITIKQIFNSIDPANRESMYDEIYLMAMAKITDPDNQEFTLSGLDINVEAGNDRLKRGYYVLQVGETQMYEADKLYQIGLHFFENENFEAAAENFIKANDINPYELAYKENAANALLRVGDDMGALKILDDLIDNFSSTSPKAFYLRGLILYEQGKKDQACQDMKYPRDEGLLDGTDLYNLMCGGKN